MATANNLQTMMFQERRPDSDPWRASQRAGPRIPQLAHNPHFFPQQPPQSVFSRTSLSHEERQVRSRTMLDMDWVNNINTLRAQNDYLSRERLAEYSRVTNSFVPAQFEPVYPYQDELDSASSGHSHHGKFLRGSDEPMPYGK